MGPTPHDAVFKAIFSDPARAMGVLRAALPPDVARLVDFDTARLVPGSFVDERLRDRHADLLFRVKLAGRDAFVYLLFEHQSESDRLMPLRLLRYRVRIWDDWLAANPGTTRLPAIVPLVLSHAEGGWKAPQRMSELYDLSAAEWEAFGPWLPEFRTALDDLTGTSDERLRTRVMDAAGRLALLLLKHARTAPDLVRLVVSWAGLFRELKHASNGPGAAGILMRNAVTVGADGRPQELVEQLEAAQAPEAAEAAMTMGERLMEEGRQTGLQQGMQQGRQQGRAQGRAEAILDVMAERGIGLTGAARDRIMGCADLDVLARWLKRAATAASAEGVFGADA